LLRHRIAHGAIGDETVGKTKAKNATSLVRQLATWTDGTVDVHLKTLPLDATSVRSFTVQGVTLGKIRVA